MFYTAQHSIFSIRRLILVQCLLALSIFASPATAQVTAFMQSVAEASSNDKAIAAFYKANGYKAIWTGRSGKDKSRRSALLKAIKSAGNHGLPVGTYETEFLKSNLFCQLLYSSMLLQGSAVVLERLDDQ